MSALQRFSPPPAATACRPEPSLFEPRGEPRAPESQLVLEGLKRELGRRRVSVKGL
jgi:hypothetical protein